MPRISKKQAIITALLLWVGITSWVIFVHQYQVMHDVPKPAPVVQLHQDPQVVAVMEALGLDYSKLNLVYGASPTNPDNLGLFQPPNTLYLQPSAPVDKRGIIVSHEYIHYAQTIDSTTAASFYPYLRHLSTTNTTLRSRANDYHQACEHYYCNIDSELEAVACTELPDSDLQANFVDWCNGYLHMRYTLFQ